MTLREEIAIQLAIWDFAVTEEEGTAAWDEATEDEREPYLKRADHFLSLVTKRVKGMEGEIKFTWRNNQEYLDGVKAGVEGFRQAVIKELEG